MLDTDNTNTATSWADFSPLEKTQKSLARQRRHYATAITAPHPPPGAVFPSLTHYSTTWKRCPAEILRNELALKSQNRQIVSRKAHSGNLRSIQRNGFPKAPPSKSKYLAIADYHQRKDFSLPRRNSNNNHRILTNTTPNNTPP